MPRATVKTFFFHEGPRRAAKNTKNYWVFLA